MESLVVAGQDLDADSVLQIPDNLSFDDAASIPLGLSTVVTGIWAHHPEANSVDFAAPWEDGGLTKYAGQAAFVVGGSSSVGQFGESLIPNSRTSESPISPVMCM